MNTLYAFLAFWYTAAAISDLKRGQGIDGMIVKLPGGGEYELGPFWGRMLAATCWPIPMQRVGVEDDTDGEGDEE